MKLIREQSVKEITPKTWDLVSVKKFIEECGRTCYKSNDKITEDSYERFYNMIKDSGHGSVLEHGTIYCTLPEETYNEIVSENEYWEVCPFKMVGFIDGNVYVSSSIKAILDAELEELFDYIATPEFEKDEDGDWIKHVPRRSFRIITNIGVSRELNRHELSLTVSEQSTRYCNYSKDKFGREISIVKPVDLNVPEDLSFLADYNKPEYEDAMDWVCAMEEAETYYMRLIERGWKPQKARGVLPLDTATEVVYTGWEDHYMGWDWKHVLGLRSPNWGAEGVHPQCADVANKIAEFFEK